MKELTVSNGQLKLIIEGLGISTFAKASVDNKRNLKKRRGHIEAFTLLEVTVVLAIMSLMVSILAVSLNRFNEQLKHTTTVQGELNQWYQFRANLWRELYTSDSLSYYNTELSVYRDSTTVNYKIEEDTLLRKSASMDWCSTHIAASSINEVIENDQKIVSLDFIWKGELMQLRYLNAPSLKREVDSYFETLE